MRLVEIYQEARDVFMRGENVTTHFKSRDLDADEKSAVIEFAYDLQSGSYTAALNEDDAVIALKTDWGRKIAALIDDLGIASFVEAGVGEATTLKFIAGACRALDVFGGFDLSLSRLVYAREVLRGQRAAPRLFAGDLTSIPMIDDACDAILTNHSMEPNGGREAAILAELLRATRRYLILVEPDYALGSDRQKLRMERLGYVRDLPAHIGALGARIVHMEAWPFNPNPDNAASLIVVEKKVANAWGAPVEQPLASPFGKQRLEKFDDHLFSREEGLAFPVVDGLPCLLRSSAIVASHLHRPIEVRR